MLLISPSLKIFERIYLNLFEFIEFVLIYEQVVDCEVMCSGLGVTVPG